MSDDQLSTRDKRVLELLQQQLGSDPGVINYDALIEPSGLDREALYRVVRKLRKYRYVIDVDGKSQCAEPGSVHASRQSNSTNGGTMGSSPSGGAGASEEEDLRLMLKDIHDAFVPDEGEKADSCGYVHKLVIIRRITAARPKLSAEVVLCELDNMVNERHLERRGHYFRLPNPEHGVRVGKSALESCIMLLEALPEDGSTVRLTAEYLSRRSLGRLKTTQFVHAISTLSDGGAIVRQPGPNADYSRGRAKSLVVYPGAAYSDGQEYPIGEIAYKPDHEIEGFVEQPIGLTSLTDSGANDLERLVSRIRYELTIIEIIEAFGNYMRLHLIPAEVSDLEEELESLKRRFASDRPVGELQSHLSLFESALERASHYVGKPIPEK